MSDSNKFSLYDIKNYKSYFTNSNKEIVTEFCKIINEYLFHMCDNILIQNKQYYIFIILRGLNMLKHIFNILLLYTKNLNLCIHHSKKAYLFYVEFIGQIGNDNHSYLQLNSKDAILFVYKKTIFEINNEYRKQFCMNNENERNVLNYVDKLSGVYIDILKVVINNDNLKKESKMSYVMYIQKMASKIINKIIYSKHSIIVNIEICDKYLYYKNLLDSKNLDMDECVFLNLSNLFLKKIQIKNISEKDIYSKIYNKDCDDNIKKYSPLKFTNWLFNRK